MRSASAAAVRTGLAALRAVGCEPVLEEHVSGADRSCPVLARLLRDIRAGETLVVIRLDRLVRLLAGIKAAVPDYTLQQIAAQLEAMRERTPSGGTAPAQVRPDLWL